MSVEYKARNMKPGHNKRRRWGKTLTFAYLLFVLIPACGNPTTAAINTPYPTDTETVLPSKTATLTSSPKPAEPTSSYTPLPPTTTPEPWICSPLEGVIISDLADMIVNRFAPPQPGSDDPHQGVDFADIDPLYRIALEGKPVQAVMDGQIAGVIEDRFPYGNAILIETPLEQIPSTRLTAIQIPTLAPPREGHPSLTCPEGVKTTAWDNTRRSLYLIYAHLQEPPLFQVGEAIVCGQQLNVIGSTGNALNPHLHLELRVGPSGATFDSMAHYTGSASIEEMDNYCLWRVSEIFQLLDPLQLFEGNPK